MNSPATPALWKIWLNPIVRRYATARLRLAPVLGWGIPIQAVGAFLWLVTFLYLHKYGGQKIQEAAAAAWTPILILQGILWIMKGTFSVALGIAREGAEGLTDAQRLTPLSAWHKVAGYLFGLPILETALVASLLPWTAASVILGKIPIIIVFRVHLLLITSAILHHAIGLVTGTVIRQKIVAGTVSQLLVIFLHLIVPIFARLGAGPLGHLGVESAITAELRPLFERHAAESPATVQFFQWDLSLTGYQWVVMSVLLSFLLLILWRRWKRADAHLFSKPLALAFFAWIVVMSLGELNPLIQNGTLFEPGKRMSQIIKTPAGSITPEAAQEVMAVIWAGVVGCVALAAAMLVAAIITPTLEQHWRALRAARNQESEGLRWTSDSRSALPWTLGLGLIAVAGWYELVKQVLDTPILSFVFRPDPAMLSILGAGLLLPLIAWGLLLEWRGMKAAMGGAFVFWMIPLMISVVAGLSGASLTGWPKWLMAFSGFTLPFLSLLQCSRGLANFGGYLHDLRQPWIASLIAHAGLAAFLWLRLRIAQKPGVDAPFEEKLPILGQAWSKPAISATAGVQENLS
jgi:hypothetical protein